MSHHQHHYSNPWSSDTQLTHVSSASLSPLISRRSHSEDPMYNNAGHGQEVRWFNLFLHISNSLILVCQKGSRVAQFRNRAGESTSARRPSTSSLSNAMGTPQMGRRNDAMSSKSSPSSDESLQEMQMAQYPPGSAFDMFSLQYAQALDRNQDISMLSPPQSNPLMLANQSVGNQPLHSPYTETPPPSSSDLPPVSAFPMHAQQFVAQGGFAPQRSSSFNVPHRSSRASLSSMPSSAPPSNSNAFTTGMHTAGSLMAKSSSPPNVLGQYPFNVSPPMYTMSSEDSEDQGSLVAHVEDLKARNAELQDQVMRLQNQLQSRPSGHVVPSLPTVPTIPPLGSNMEASWEKRTQARVRKFCAPNRAGNSLCSWHDTRRERRAHPPRMAPDGFLNCGCTAEEALFEESLARNGVGSYHPGDTVRMDPLLRNALLRLLKSRYGYRDGDFEIDPRTGRWMEGEGHEKWERELHHPGHGPKGAPRK